MKFLKKILSKIKKRLFKPTRRNKLEQELKILSWTMKYEYNRKGFTDRWYDLRDRSCYIKTLLAPTRMYC